MEMNKERYNQIIDEAYNNYVKTSKPTLDGKYISQPEFIFWVKTNGEFSEKWGLKIEERELSHDKRYVWYKNNTHLIPSHFRNQAKEFEDKYVPTKLITLTYNNETIEVYE